MKLICKPVVVVTSYRSSFCLSTDVKFLSQDRLVRQDQGRLVIRQGSCWILIFKCGENTDLYGDVDV